MTTKTPAAKGLGRAQRQVILCLMDGEDRSAGRIDDDMMLSPGTARGALQGLWSRSIVDRRFSHNEIEWYLTGIGSVVAEELFPFGEDEDQ